MKQRPRGKHPVPGTNKSRVERRALVSAHCISATKPLRLRRVAEIRTAAGLRAQCCALRFRRRNLGRQRKKVLGAPTCRESSNKLIQEI